MKEGEHLNRWPQRNATKAKKNKAMENQERHGKLT